MKRAQLVAIRAREFKEHEYKRVFYRYFDYEYLSKILTIRRSGRGTNESFNDVIIAADTETSKKRKNDSYIEHGKIKYNSYSNHVVLWTITLRAYGSNLVTLYGRTPSQMIECFEMLRESMSGEKSIIYFHNWPYDYVFLRKFMFKKWGFPQKILNIKPHYPLYMEFQNGLIIKDSLALAQRSLSKWSSDLHTEHGKLVDQYDYEDMRGQHSRIPWRDKRYAEYDTLSLAECIDATMKMLNKRIYSIPLTATGIVREDVRMEGMKHGGHDQFLRSALTYEQYIKCCKIYHGGYTHANRHYIGQVIKFLVKCYDFASSYPYCMIAYKYPHGKFTATKDCHVEDIIKYKDKYAFMCKLTLVNYSILNDNISMPPISLSKCDKIINPVVDNGRILSAEYLETWVNEVDLDTIYKYSKWSGDACTEVEYCIKAYLPRWFTDLVYKYFQLKTTLKTSDDFIAYMLSKAKLNSLYGLCVQKSIKALINEDYTTGEYIEEKGVDDRELYEKYLNKKTNVLNYQTGCWVTSYAQSNLFYLCNECTDQADWYYSDTDSGYSSNWKEDKIKDYNERCKQLVAANGYGPVIHEGKEYNLGVAESKPNEDEYTEYVALGAKRYCGRNKEDGKLHITVAGVPKRGASALTDISDFKRGFIFSGKITGKKTHAYVYVDDIYIDDNGNETGDSIDLYPCDYLLDEVSIDNWYDYIEGSEVMLPVYDEGRI